ncbi:pyridoxamine 5'-phosphate oxidase family protein [Coccidioides posadasii C735 delta SOWgp]|uniref:Pyridoxamine 5'-phosphate oxidase N-terminal domain-containing protein n=3 Tax=Coccidioides TaxID=5500 RepID=A0A0J6XVW8_COCIT|nr:pyridoxamine 5'-phosphate oxidase family protein [Coccidioides posadasii C735 delta SOWgp]EER24377.1 pyridoxamine 5'-phosphate oxidase family protein [Coccidioides posadasii C735 delta SOWgp]KMM66076.1 hypothetical protein CPAG_02416 [Coccidioides posadasii RMSCC 3488]KMP00341.1 hypothetical protein CIRG_00483 [Coccidioides immitis RMSCC 2394]|eukprot:XP_003066522.1 pyridoxamine 5'-phosphate oxidase family protein [Coccidioides posadasii C735 delta SOWgp]
MASHNPPLSYEPSATTTHPRYSTTLPPEVVSCLKNSRFLHLATCDNLTPHISLMSYTYLPSTPFSAHPTIIMTTNPSSKKTINLLSNPRVSLLVHDWVSHRPPTRTRDPAREGSPPPAATQSSLATLLLNINTSAMSSISTTITGTARFLEAGSEEEKWCKERHLENNTFASDSSEMGIFGRPAEGGCVGGDEGGQDVDVPVVEDDVRVVIVQVKEGRIADWKGGVRDWVVVSEDEERQIREGQLQPNGIWSS